MFRFGAQSLRDRINDAASFLQAYDVTVSVAGLRHATGLRGNLAELSGRSVLVATRKQLTAALALIELAGLARRLIILPADVNADHLAAIIAAAEIDTVVLDGDDPPAVRDLPLRVECSPSLTPLAQIPPSDAHTEWVLLTSGTTGAPKMVNHTLRGLTAAIGEASPADGAAVWATFYDIRRYGGLQIFLRAMLNGASLVLADADEPVADHLFRLGRCGVTHLSGTPSHWRRALMNPALKEIAPRYVRLSGEIADQAILDALRLAFPSARIGHAYASTEAGVAFDVNDGLAGFPASYVGEVRNGVEMKVVDDSLTIRSERTASCYLGRENALADGEGFVDTGDILERRGDRYYFVGRKGGIINVGGLKVHPEEIEAVINQHPLVHMSLVQPRHSPITGAIVSADVVLSGQGDGRHSETKDEILKNEILSLCRTGLARHKVPASIQFVSNLAVAATGKLKRRHG
ncbi:MAG TPA: class I adenylate-forming enzyme family protein [Xanthobacteraceae bacterium]|nr:class I adenylate-forming enzyme family protein [Xanthobacteraceae bacterium]